MGTSKECWEKHTEVDPELSDFRCPSCGEGCGRNFGITDDGGVGTFGCPKLHLEDALNCSRCGWEGTGEEWMAAQPKPKAPVAEKKDVPMDTRITAWTPNNYQRQRGPIFMSVTKIGEKWHWVVRHQRNDQFINIVGGGLMESGDSASAEEAMKAADSWMVEFINAISRPREG